MIPLSVVIITKNEEKNIRDCLESIYDWADEIIVVDDESTDKTIEITRQYTDKIFIRRMDNEGRHRNWSYSQAKNIWVLSLDADERITEELKKEINEVLNKNHSYVAFSIPLRNYIGERWIRYGGWYPAGKVRLFKKDKFKYEEVGVHPRAFIDGECGHLKSDIIHKGYKNFEEFINSINNQTTLEAKKWLDTNRKMTLLHAFWRAIDRFFRRFIRKRGYKDGFYGFMIGFSDSLYQILSYAKYRELKSKK
ncbi:MAG: glycosyltransferase family 2 protein [Candidatus Omnitrophica bacterium]|nr:glycosyltransferase family 2 protein [Candidatus Omnitrophota bacterium]